MKKTTFILLLTLILASCGTRSGQFKIEGQFLNLNQGEFFVYSLDGTVPNIDTIRVNGGRFAYQIPCTRPGVLMLVFPNYSEQPVFAESGGSVSIKADASHLKELTVTGTDANERMTAFRKRIASASPPECKNVAEEFIQDEPESPVSAYLLFHYFVKTPPRDYAKARRLAEKVMQSQPKNGTLSRLYQDLKVLQVGQKGSQLPSFSATDINGRGFTSNDLHGKVGVIHVWSTWNYESQDVQRRIRDVRKEKGNRLTVIGICVDGTKRECRNYLRRDSLPWSTVCDEMSFDSPLLAKLGVQSIPDNIVFDSSGRIVARGLNPDEMKKKLEEMLK
ncbi:MAG: AhpC/TSA family protein [Prevotella sp.]|nr:AhpC/TSA family protein [Prevotella sp.]